MNVFIVSKYFVAEFLCNRGCVAEFFRNRDCVAIFFQHECCFWKKMQQGQCYRKYLRLFFFFLQHGYCCGGQFCNTRNVAGGETQRHAYTRCTEEAEDHSSAICLLKVSVSHTWATRSAFQRYNIVFWRTMHIYLNHEILMHAALDSSPFFWLSLLTLFLRGTCLHREP